MREILFRGKDVKHCKNCKNFMHINSTQHICDEFGGYVDEDDFCSRGEKHEGKEKKGEKNERSTLFFQN